MLTQSHVGVQIVAISCVNKNIQLDPKDKYEL